MSLLPRSRRTRRGAGRVARLVLASATLPLLAKTADNPDGIDRSLIESVWEAWHSHWPRWIAVSNPLEITGAKTAKLVPGAEFKVYDNAPHGLVITHLGRFEEDLVGFMTADHSSIHSH
jgi:hypothetical protein